MKRKLAFLTALIMGMSAVSVTNVVDSKYITASAETKKYELKEDEARVILTDYDTGELIQFEADEHGITNISTTIGYISDYSPGGWMYTRPIYPIKCNPYYCDLAKFMDADLFDIRLSYAPDGYTIPDDYKVITKNDNGSLEIEFRLKKDYTKGDINADGAFTVADVVMLQKWLLGVPDVTLFNWSSADLCEDGELNVFDLCMMKRELLNKSEEKYIEPDNKVLYGESFDILYENTKMYSGPGEEYPITAIVPKNETLNEIGYNDGNDDWVFTQYKGQYGWIKTEDVRF